MSQPVVFPPIKDGIYHISSLFPEFYLELQRDGSLRAMKLNRMSETQKWKIILVEDGTYEIRCVQGNCELPCETYYAHKNPVRHKTQLWTIDPRGISFVIANAFDYRALDLVIDNMVGFSERDNVRGQRWVLHQIGASDDTSSLDTQMAAMQPFPSPGAPASGVGMPMPDRSLGWHHKQKLDARPEHVHQGSTNPNSIKHCPPVNSMRVRKTLITHAIVREGVYRITSAIRKEEDGVGFLELQQDSYVRVARLDESSNGQKWSITYQDGKYHIKSLLNSCALALRPSASNPNVMVPVGVTNASTSWTIEPRHDAYFIGVLGEEHVLDFTENNNVVFENLNGCTTQRWDLDPLRFEYHPVYKPGKKYLIKNCSTGHVIWFRGNTDWCTYGTDDGDTALQFTFRDQEDGGTAMRSVAHGVYLAPELNTSTTSYSCRFILAQPGSKWYYICPDMDSNPPMVFQEQMPSGKIELTELEANNELNMWELVLKL